VIGLVLASAAVIWAIRETLTTLILALLLAYLLNPLVAFLQRRWRISRLLATGLIYLVLIALLIATVVALEPTLFRQLGALAAGFDQILVQISATLRQLPLLDALGIRMDSTTLTDQLRDRKSVV
jgi:putative permease